MQSPLKGLERLTEELRVERAKCTEALREVARYRVENGTLEEAKEDLEAELQECKRRATEDRSEIARLENALDSLGSDFDALQDEAAAKDAEYQSTYEERNRLQAENESLMDLLREKDGQLSALTLKCQSLETRAAARDDVLNKQKAEINEMRASRDAAMKELLDANEALHKQMEWNEELKLELGKLETMSDGYEQTRSSNDELREALDAANKTSAMYQEQLRELKAKLKERSTVEANLEQTIRMLAAEKEELKKECRDLEESRRLMADQVQSEIAASEAAKRHAETVAAGRDFMDRTMHEMQDKHDQLLRQIGERDKQLSEANIAISDLQGELSTMKERLAQAEAGVERSSSVQEMLLQVETLRAQLAELRTEKRRREMEEAAGVLAPKAVMDRIEENKQFYEGVIQQLRVDLEQANTQAREFEHRYHQEQRKAHRLQSLEDEVAMYRDIAQRTSQESQDAALSISEEKNRATKAMQEKTALLHKLHRANADLEGAQGELQRANEELTALREKVKTFHAARIAADKRVADASTAHSKTETALEEVKQKYDALSLELDKARRAAQEHTFRISELQIKCDEAEAARADANQLSTRLVQVKNDAAGRERELTLQIETLRHQKAALERELQATRDKVGTYRSSLDTVSADLSRLRAEYDTLVTERDRLRRALQDNENKHAEEALFQLKCAVEESTQELNTHAEEQSAKDKIIQQITAECSKEREKVTILKMQVATLEDKLRVANQELSVFRGIDVYHSTMQAQLNSYRRDRSFNESAMDVSAIKGDHRLDRTDRDLGSAFANTINLASAQRPPSRASRASYDDESDLDDGPYRAEPQARHSRSPTPSGEAARAALSASPPILRPAPQFVTAPARVATTGPVAATGSFRSDIFSQQQQLSQSRQEDFETRSVASDYRDSAGARGSAAYERAIPAEETKSESRAAGHDSNIFSFTRPIPRSPTTATPAAPGRDESIIVDDAPSGARGGNVIGHAGTGDLEAERRELLRRRAERKALRDQQLRERILREGNLNSSFSASRGAFAAPSSSAAAAADMRDDLSQSSVSSSVSGVREQAYRRESSRPRHGAAQQHASSYAQDTPLATQPTASRRHTVAASARTGDRRSTSPAPAPGISRITDLAQRASIHNANLTTASAAQATAPAAYRPRVPDYARARSLLNM